MVEEYRAPDETGDGGREVAGSPITVTASMPESMADATVPPDDLEPRKTRLLPLSGKSESALRELAGRYLSWLDQRTGPDRVDRAVGLAGQTADSHSGNVDGEAGLDGLLSDMAWTSGVGRSHFDHRAGMVFHDTGSLRERLTELAEAGPIEHALKPAKVAFVYTGQGSQWIGMGQALYEQEPVARAVLDRCEAVFQEVRGTSLLDVMFGRNEAEGTAERHGLGATGALRIGMCADGTLVECRRAAGRGHGPQRRRELAAAHAAGGIQPGGRDAVRRHAGHPVVRNRRRRHGRGFCDRGTGRRRTGRAERGGRRQ